MGVQPPCPAPFSAAIIRSIKIKAHQLSRKPEFGSSEREDIAQELTLRLWQKSGKYDPSRGASFDTFARCVITSAVRMMLRERSRLKRYPGFRAASLDSGTKEIKGTLVPIEDTLVEDDRRRLTRNAPANPDTELTRAVDRVIATLSEPAISIGKRLKDGDKIIAIAKELGISRQQVYKMQKLIREKAMDAGYPVD